MVMKTTNYKKIAFFLASIVLLGSCAKERSTATGWEYNNYENGGFEKFDAQEQETGPGLVLIEGGTFTCLLYTSPSPRDLSTSRMPSSA